MQYYESTSTAKANAILILMLVDPALYNGILYYFISYLWVRPTDDGGCCAVQTSASPLTFFLIVYLSVHFIYSFILSLQFYKGLRNQSKCGLFILFLATITNLHMFLLGLCPCVHQVFGMHELYRGVRMTVVRNPAYIAL